MDAIQSCSSRSPSQSPESRWPSDLLETAAPRESPESEPVPAASSSASRCF